MQKYSSQQLAEELQTQGGRKSALTSVMSSHSPSVGKVHSNPTLASI